MNDFYAETYFSKLANKIRWPLLATGIVLLLACAWPLFFCYEQHQLYDQIEQSRQYLARQQNDLEEQRKSQQAQQQGFDFYRMLDSRHAFAKIDHLAWIDAMSSISRVSGIPFFQYEFMEMEKKGGQAATDSQQPIAHAHWQVVRQPVRIGLELLHEGDLLGFISNMSDKTGALLDIRGCNVVRSRQTDTLKAECEIDWVSVLPGLLKVPKPLTPSTADAD